MKVQVLMNISEILRVVPHVQNEGTMDALWLKVSQKSKARLYQDAQRFVR